MGFVLAVAVSGDNWFDRHEGTSVFIATLVVAGVTAVLAFITWRSLKHTSEAVEAARDSADQARIANEQARDGNVILARSSFGAHLIVFRLDGKFITRNLGLAPAYDLIFDFWVDDQPLGSTPVKRAFLAGVPTQARGEDFYLGLNEREDPLPAPDGWTYVEGDKPDASTRTAKVNLRYRDQLGDQETFSVPFPMRRQ